MNREGYAVYGVCACGFRAVAPFGRLFFINHEHCPECAAPKREWELIVSRWVSQSIWWKPSTWGAGYWEDRRDIRPTDAYGK